VILIYVIWKLGSSTVKHSLANIFGPVLCPLTYWQWFTGLVE